MADFTPEQEKEFEMRYRYEQEQKQAAQQKQAAPEEDKFVNPLVPTIGGAIAGNIIAPGINAMSRELQGSQLAKSLGVPMDALELNAREKYQLKSGYAMGNADNVREGSDLFNKNTARMNELLEKQNRPVSSIAKHATRALSQAEIDELAQLKHSLGPGLAAENAAIQARLDAAKNAARPLVEKMGMSPKVSQGLEVANAGAKAVPAVLGRALGGAGAAFEGVDAYNRFQNGDITGGIIGGLGALGSAAAFIPTMPTRIGGTALGMGAAALNAYLDSLKEQAAAKKNKQAQPAGGLPQ